MRDKMKRAGVKTDDAQLYTLAVEALQRNDRDPRRALAGFDKKVAGDRDIRHALELYYLQVVAMDMTATKAPAEGQNISDIQADRAPAGASSREPEPNVKSYRVGPTYRRSPEEIEAARSAALVGAGAAYDYRIAGRPVGDITWAELGGLRARIATDAASYLRQGTHETEQALVLLRLDQHTAVADGTVRVRDVVNAEKLSEFIYEARIGAPRVIAHHMHAQADALQRPETLELMHAS